MRKRRKRKISRKKDDIDALKVLILFFFFLKEDRDLRKDFKHEKEELIEKILNVIDRLKNLNK